MLIRGWALIKFSPFSASEVCLFCNKTINANNKTRRKLLPRGGLLFEFIHSSGSGGGECLFEFDWEKGVGACSRLGAYLLFLPLGWALIRGGR